MRFLSSPKHPNYPFKVQVGKNSERYIWEQDKEDHLFDLAFGLSSPIAESGQDGDRGGGPCPPNGLMPILASLVPAEMKISSVLKA